MTDNPFRDYLKKVAAESLPVVLQPGILITGTLDGERTMNEQEWQTTTDVAAMLRSLHEDHGWGGPLAPDGKRKLRLYAVACARSCWALLVDPRSRQAVEAGERFADGEATDSERDAAWQAASDAAEDFDRVYEVESFNLAVMAQSCVRKDTGGMLRANRSRVPPATQAALLRSLVGNPFRPVTLDPALRTPLVLSLSRAAYQERLETGQLDPERLGVLCDCLEEEGCTADCVHCQGKGFHQTGLVRCDWSGIHDSRKDIPCSACDQTGHIPHPLLVALREPVTRWRGWWALDVLLGKS